MSTDRWAAIESLVAWELAESAARLEIGGVILGDGLQGLSSLAAGSVDLVLSDLPSGETEAEFDRAPDLSALFGATWRALKRDGVAVFMASSLRFAAACMAAGGKAYRYDLIWEKSLATGFMNTQHRPLRAHEYVLVFSRVRGCFCPQMTEGHAPTRTGKSKTQRSAENYREGLHENNTRKKGATDRYPRSVLFVANLHQRDPFRVHPQQKPDSLLRWLVRTYSRLGELVVDPYAGSGSTVVAAEAEGRRAIGWDSSPRFGVAS